MLKIHSIKIGGEITNAELDGISYTVVPGVIIIEGVLNGELVPGDEIAAYVGAWNGIPLALNHPKDENGNDISANADPFLPRYGYFFNAVWHENGRKLAGEFWINGDKLAKSPSGHIFDKILDGETVEVSSSFFRDIEPRSGVFGNRAYSRISRNIRPDHVALLPNEKGACSVDDGCGVPVANKASNGLDFQTSVMIALYPSRSMAADLALVPDSEPEAVKVLAADDLHVTVAYLGEMDELSITEGDLLNALAAFSKHAPIIYGDVQGVGAFTPRYEGAAVPFFALVTSDQIVDMRRDLLDWFLQTSVKNRPNYQPHITLCYYPPQLDRIDAPMIARQSLVFDTISLVWGEKRTHFSLQGQHDGDAIPLLSHALEGKLSNEDGDLMDEEKLLEAINGLTDQVKALNDKADDQKSSLETLQTAVTNQNERLEVVEGLAANIKAESEREREAVIASLEASPDCPLGRSALDKLESDDLKALAAEYMPQGSTDYVGRVPVVANSDDGWEDYGD